MSHDRSPHLDCSRLCRDQPDAAGADVVEVVEVEDMNTCWISTATDLPEHNLVVETKIDDADGERNVIRLKRQGALWFVPDGSMYVYYWPTHWRKVQP